AVKGLKAATAYLDRTRGLLSNDTFKDVAIQQAKQWRQRIARMNLSKVEDAGRLLEEVSAGSWPEDMKQELLQAVAKRGGEGSKEPLAMRQRQNMKNFGAYMTTSDMDQLRQGVGQACGVEIQNAQHGNDMLRDLKKSLKTKVRKVERDEDAVHVLDFPALPQGLKDTLGSPAYETWWQNAYGEREQPLGEGFRTGAGP
ncbi:unnamed protein product, partial [Effrenium voratum]